MEERRRTVEWRGAAVEAILAACGSVDLEELARLLECDVDDVEQSIAAFERGALRGICVRVVDRHAVLEVSGVFAGLVRRALGTSERRLSRAALEALAVVAYLQPVTRAQISELRGVSSDGVVRTLRDRGLIEEVPGSDPVTYRTSPRFLARAGLASLSELPPLGRFMPDAHEVADVEARLRASSE